MAEQQGAQVLDEHGRRRVRVDPARVGHHVGRAAAERGRLPAGLGRAVDRNAVAREADEADAAGSQPLDQRLDPLGAGPILGRSQLVGTRGRALHEVGHADAVGGQRVAGVAIARHEARGQRGGPEPVPGAREADTGVGREQARVQADEQHAHRRADGVGKCPQPRRGHFDSTVAAVDDLVDRKARALDNPAEPHGIP